MFGILFTILGTIPFFAKLLGFTAAGIATGTPAAVAMSKWALLFGYVGAKTPIAILQYIGTWKLSTAAGTSLVGYILSYFV
jgi:hypothetical protein